MTSQNYKMREYLNTLPANTKMIDLSSKNLFEFPDLTKFTQLEVFLCNNNYFKHMNSLSSLENLKVIKCSNNLLQSLPDLSKNKHLYSLECCNNELTSIVLYKSISILNCDNNQITEFIQPSYTESNLTILECSHNKLSKLPEFNFNLISVVCVENNITNLPKLNAKLEVLICSHNKLQYLPSLTDCENLRELNCSDNLLQQLPQLTNCTSLRKLYCSNNKLTLLPKLNNSLKTLECSSNKLTQLPTLNYLLTRLNPYYNCCLVNYNNKYARTIYLQDIYPNYNFKTIRIINRFRENYYSILIVNMLFYKKVRAKMLLLKSPLIERERAYRFRPAVILQILQNENITHEDGSFELAIKKIENDEY
jgi:Leucine-rich repeat (LRR) protein